MQRRLKRGELDHLAKFYSLDEARIETLFELSGARPTRAEGLAFLGSCLRIGGILSLAASIVFFVAANWSDIAVFGRFALIELVLLACGVVAILKPPPAAVGRGALFLAFVATGALLALFGQTYQTGADVYELFLGWSLLGLPLVLIARWGVTSAAWVIVFNTALMLYCGWMPAGGLLWTVLGGHWSSVGVLLLAAALNVVLWFAVEMRRPESAPGWVRRLLISCAFGFATWCGIRAVFPEYGEVVVAPRVIGFVGVAILMVAVGAYALRRREDIYPLAVACGSFILIGLVAIARAISWSNESGFFILALWLIGTSMAGGRLLMSLMRQWREEAVA